MTLIGPIGDHKNADEKGSFDLKNIRDLSVSMTSLV
jgi:hypothetical protein